MLILYKLLIFFCFMCVVVAMPTISAGITFGAPIYRPIPTPIYYERPYQHYYHHDNYYYDGPNLYPYGYSSNYDFAGGGIGGVYGSIDYSPFLLR